MFIEVMMIEASTVNKPKVLLFPAPTPIPQTSDPSALFLPRSS